MDYYRVEYNRSMTNRSRVAPGCLSAVGVVAIALCTGFTWLTAEGIRFVSEGVTVAGFNAEANKGWITLEQSSQPSSVGGVMIDGLPEMKRGRSTNGSPFWCGILSRGYYDGRINVRYGCVVR